MGVSSSGGTLYLIFIYKKAYLIYSIEYSFEGRLRRRLAYKHFNKSSISQPSYLNLEAFSTSLGLHGCYYKEYLRITKY